MKSRLMQQIFLGQPKPDQPIKLLDEAAEPKPLDWPDIDTVRSELDDSDGCSWKDSGFI